MFNKVLIFLFCAVFWNTVSGAKDFPAHFPRCKRTDPNLEECLLKATEEVRPDIRKGIPDFLPGIEKFVVPEITMQQGTRAVNYKAHFKNVTLLGLDQYKFTRYQFLPGNLTFFIEVNLPFLYIDAKYVIEGNILFAPIKGDGEFRANITNSNCSVYHEVIIEKRNGTDYLKPTLTVPTMHIGTVEDYTFDGIFRDNEQLAQATRNVIRENLNVIVEEFTPAVEKVLAAIFDEVIFKAVTQIPYDKLYPK
ncbi:uncharacterized protein LOC108917748 [Anoplophora glabripennis]|uniref:uncharacterized protein LOC108917748 n=1 Tax=Anoplophora glabripennis TaxID=217634 RepID=UPI000874244F|nr:uncharacterized protein LOC108917748 [Anoplophora glabripennis]